MMRRPVRFLVVFVEGNLRLVDAEMLEEEARFAGILARDEVHRALGCRGHGG